MRDESLSSVCSGLSLDICLASVGFFHLVSKLLHRKRMTTIVLHIDSKVIQLELSMAYQVVWKWQSITLMSQRLTWAFMLSHDCVQIHFPLKLPAWSCWMLCQACERNEGVLRIVNKSWKSTHPVAELRALQHNNYVWAQFHTIQVVVHILV